MRHECLAFTLAGAYSLRYEVEPMGWGRYLVVAKQNLMVRGHPDVGGISADFQKLQEAQRLIDDE